MMGCYGYMGFLCCVCDVDRCVVDEVLVCVNMQEFCYCQIGELLGGQKKCVFLVCVLVQGVLVILLDEFFIGVDVKIEVVIIELLCQMWVEGWVMLVLIYDLGLVLEFCDWVVLVKGMVLVLGFMFEVFIFENLCEVFGGVLCYFMLGGLNLYDDDDLCGLMVLFDDEWLLVFYDGKQCNMEVLFK